MTVPLPTPGTPPDAAQLSQSFVELCEVIAKLRSPEGCPWDRVQTLKTIKPFTLEETYELLEAIDSDDNEHIKEELGDVLLQVVLDAQIAADENRFDIVAVIQGLTQKMISRHPHVFGTAHAETADDVRSHWEKQKAKEKSARTSALDGIPVDLPALAKAVRIQKKAARVGYDFPHRAMLFDKLREELDELKAELYPNDDLPDIPAAVDMEPVPDTPIDDPARQDRMEEELGDVLFVLANIARRWEINPEEALRRSNRKFAGRFRHIEQGLTQIGKSIKDANLEEMEEFYQAAKLIEKSKASSLSKAT